METLHQLFFQPSFTPNFDICIHRQSPTHFIFNPINIFLFVFQRTLGGDNSVWQLHGFLISLPELPQHFAWVG